MRVRVRCFGVCPCLLFASNFVNKHPEFNPTRLLHARYSYDSTLATRSSPLDAGVHLSLSTGGKTAHNPVTPASCVSGCGPFEFL